jgi:hypothetical protein
MSTSTPHSSTLHSTLEDAAASPRLTNQGSTMTPTTIGEAFATLGRDIHDPSCDYAVAHFPTPSSTPIHYTVRECADWPIAEFDGALYGVLGATFKPGTIRRGGGRETENVKAISEFPFDIDAKNFLDLSKETIQALPQDELDEHIAVLVAEARRLFALAKIPIHRIRYSGYGIYVDVRIADEDQHRVAEISALHKGLIARVNAFADRKFVDTGVSDPGTRITRVPGARNRKNPEMPRLVRTSFEVPGAVRLDQLPPVPRPPVSEHITPDDVDTMRLADADVNALITVIARDYVDGVRNEICLRMPTMLLKAGVPRGQIEAIFEEITANDENPSKGMGDAGRTCDRWELGLPIDGYTGLVRTLGVDHRLTVGVSDILDRCKAAARRAAAKEASDAIAVPDFPLHILPDDVRRYVEQAATLTAVPVEMVAAPFLAYTGGLLGNRLFLRMHALWDAYPGLTLAVVAPPGSGKTPALTAASKPLRRLQQEAGAKYRKQREQYECDMGQWRKAKKEGAQPTEPALHHYRTTNITTEAVGPMLEDSSGLVVDQDELSGWVRGMDQYKGGRGADRQFWLSVFSNTEIKNDRKGATTIYVPKPVVSVVGGIQPDLVKSLRPSKGEEDGFVDRILPIVPVCAPALWSWDVVMPTETVQGVHDLYHRLDLFPATSLDDDDGGIHITLSAEAKEIWQAWFDENHGELVPNAPSSLAAGFYLKLETYVPRFALLLHALHNPPTPTQTLPGNRGQYPSTLSGEHMQWAIDLAEFFRIHIHRFLVLLGAQGPESGNVLWERIERALQRDGADDDDGWVMQSGLQRTLGNTVTAKMLSAALAEMQAVGRVEHRIRPSATKKADEWRLAPKEAQSPE